MDNSNKKKNEQLGMPYGTACARLRKSVLFDLLKETGKNVCFQCGRIIESEEELSIEHKVPYLDSDDPKGLFFNLDNIAFSHLKCNVGAARRSTEVRRDSQRIRIQNGESKRTSLNKEKVLQIRELLKTKTRREVCDLLGLSKSCVAFIARGETFSYIR